MARILLVEDELLVRELAFEDLSDAGHDVTVAGSGDEALEILHQDTGFDVLFTDIRMPGEIDGWQLAEEVRERIPGIRIIFATGLNDDTGWKKPGDRMLSKPYRKEDLLKALT
jgi:CheY-like chemotaxis protein